MKIIFWAIGSKHESYIKEGLEDFTQRINHYFHCEWKKISPPKHSGSLTAEEQRNLESKSLLAALDPVDYVILLDERGKMLTSPRLAELMEERAVNGAKTFQHSGIRSLEFT